MGFFDSITNVVEDVWDTSTDLISDTVLGTINIFTPEGHTIKTIKRYDPIYDNNGKDPPRMISPGHSETIEEHDGVWAYLANRGEAAIEVGENDFEHIVDQGIGSGERVLESGLDVAKTTVDDLGELGTKIIDDSAGILSTPLIIIAGGLATMLYLSGRQAPQIASAMRYI